MQAQIIHTTVHVPFEKAYDFARKPENVPKWAADMSSSLHETDTGRRQRGPRARRRSDSASQTTSAFWIIGCNSMESPRCTCRLA